RRRDRGAGRQTDRRDLRRRRRAGLPGAGDRGHAGAAAAAGRAVARRWRGHLGADPRRARRSPGGLAPGQRRQRGPPGRAEHRAPAAARQRARQAGPADGRAAAAVPGRGHPGGGDRRPGPRAGRGVDPGGDATMTAPEITTIEVAAERPYQGQVGPGLLDRLPALAEGALRIAVIHPSALIQTAESVAAVLTEAGLEVTRIDVPNGEAAKTAEVAATCWSVLGNAGFTRSDLIIGLGGGATTDLAGFVAATWLRGVGLITVPTTVLGMVDAAVGGKTGINTAEGKNLVGAFWEPRGVLCDLDLLAGLPRAEVISGLAEVIKCGFIADPVILDLIEPDPDAASRLGTPVLREVIERSIAVKARVVSADLRESTSVGDRIGRELINYGHTLGHAIERREAYRWRHGEAISIGMIFVAELSRLAGLLDEETARRHRALLGAVGLPTSYPVSAFDDLLGTMALDKKTRGGTLRFVVLEALAKARILAGP